MLYDLENCKNLECNNNYYNTQVSLIWTKFFSIPKVTQPLLVLYARKTQLASVFEMR